MIAKLNLNRQFLHFASCASAAILLTACGGGGDSSQTALTSQALAATATIAANSDIPRDTSLSSVAPTEAVSAESAGVATVSAAPAVSLASAETATVAASAAAASAAVSTATDVSAVVPVSATVPVQVVKETVAFTPATPPVAVAPIALVPVAVAPIAVAPVAVSSMPTAPALPAANLPNTLAAEIVIAPAAPASPAPAPGKESAAAPFGQNAALYTMTFSDEFSGDLNRSVWNDKIWYESAPGTKNYAVENGALKIWPARDASGKFFNRTIDTDGKYYQTYGYFEVEAKLPKGKGTWPAFWLFNHINNRRPEIDVMEAYAGGAAPWGKVVNGVANPTMYAATIWKDATVQAGFFKVPTPDLSAGFHKYALKWEPNKQTFYFDGKEIYSVNVTMADRMYLMLDLWYGSASGQADNSTPVGKNNAYEVNYVRAWKLK